MAYRSLLLRVGSLELRQAGATLHCRERASYCSGFSYCRAWTLGARISVVMARGLSSYGSWALEHGLSSCGTWVQLLLGMRDPPRSGIEPIHAALQSGFLTTRSAGECQANLLKCSSKPSLMAGAPLFAWKTSSPQKFPSQRESPTPFLPHLPSSSPATFM